jgi:hypothetical protein
MAINKIRCIVLGECMIKTVYNLFMSIKNFILEWLSRVCILAAHIAFERDLQA